MNFWQSIYILNIKIDANNNSHEFEMICFRKQFEIEETVISINTTKQTVDKCKQPVQEVKSTTIDQPQPKMSDKREKTPVGSNPFGTPEESPERDSNNPFGEPTEDDYDSELNPFAE